MTGRLPFQSMQLFSQFVIHAQTTVVLNHLNHSVFAEIVKNTITSTETEVKIGIGPIVR